MGPSHFYAICLDLLGPILVKSMIKKRDTMKVWPILFVCQSTGAVHCELMHGYGTHAFLLQWYRFTAIRGHPAVAVSDCGSQLTSAKNQAPENWDWDGVKHDGAGRGTVWRFVPPGA